MSGEKGQGDNGDPNGKGKEDIFNIILKDTRIEQAAKIPISNMDIHGIRDLGIKLASFKQQLSDNPNASTYIVNGLPVTRDKFGAMLKEDHDDFELTFLLSPNNILSQAEGQPVPMPLTPPAASVGTPPQAATDEIVANNTGKPGAANPGTATTGDANQKAPNPFDVPAVGAANPGTATTGAANQKAPNPFDDPVVEAANPGISSQPVRPQPVVTTTPFQNTQANTPEERLVALPVITRLLTPSETQQNNATAPLTSPQLERIAKLREEVELIEAQMSAYKNAIPIALRSEAETAARALQDAQRGLFEIAKADNSGNKESSVNEMNQLLKERRNLLRGSPSSALSDNAKKLKEYVDSSRQTSFDSVLNQVDKALREDSQAQFNLNSKEVLPRIGGEVYRVTAARMQELQAEKERLNGDIEKLSSPFPALDTTNQSRGTPVFPTPPTSPVLRAASANQSSQANSGQQNSATPPVATANREQQQNERKTPQQWMEHISELNKKIDHTKKVLEQYDAGIEKFVGEKGFEKDAKELSDSNNDLVKPPKGLTDQKKINQRKTEIFALLGTRNHLLKQEPPNTTLIDQNTKSLCEVNKCDLDDLEERDEKWKKVVANEKETAKQKIEIKDPNDNSKVIALDQQEAQKLRMELAKLEEEKALSESKAARQAGERAPVQNSARCTDPNPKPFDFTATKDVLEGFKNSYPCKEDSSSGAVKFTSTAPPPPPTHTTTVTKDGVSTTSQDEAVLRQNARLYLKLAKENGRGVTDDDVKITGKNADMLREIFRDERKKMELQEQEASSFKDANPSTPTADGKKTPTPPVQGQVGNTDDKKDKKDKDADTDNDNDSEDKPKTPRP